MKKRSGFKVMARLIGLVKPLSGYGPCRFHGACWPPCRNLYNNLRRLCRNRRSGHKGSLFHDLYNRFGHRVRPFERGFALCRAILQPLYRLQAFGAYKRKGLYRAAQALPRKACQGKDKGDLISVITSDIELLGGFLRPHGLPRFDCRSFFGPSLSFYRQIFTPFLGLIALAAYVTVGAVIPVATSKISGGDGLRFRTESGELSGFVLDSLRGLPEILQYDCGEKRLEEMNVKIDGLSAAQKRMKNRASQNQGVTGTVILIFDLIMLLASAALYKNGSIDFAGTVIPTIALMSSFGPTVALFKPRQHTSKHLCRRQPRSRHFGRESRRRGNIRRTGH